MCVCLIILLLLQCCTDVLQVRHFLFCHIHVTEGDADAVAIKIV